MMTAGLIQFSPVVPWPFIALFAACALALIVVGALRRGKGLIARFTFFLILTLSLLDPRLVEEQREPQADVALMVVDRSTSQRTGDRLKQVEQAETALLESFAKIDGMEVRTIEVTDLTDDASEGTQVMDALAAAKADVPAGRYAGAVIITDGQIHDTDGALHNRKDAPVHVLLTGNPGERDRRLVVDKAPGFGIVGKEVSVTFRIEDTHQGPEGVSAKPSAEVTYRKDGEVLETNLVPVGEPFTYTFELDHAGPTLLELETSPAEGELSDVNNRALVSINGVRDRLRVLLVSGQPHAAERTWRNLLKSDPSVDLVHFTILRPPEKDDFTPLNELALIAFPTQELFIERIDEFDLIVFDRYQIRDVLRMTHLANIARHIRNGGALLLAVGPEFAGLRSLYHTPLKGVSPIAPTGGIAETGFKPRVSDIGERHPVTAPLAHGQDTLPDWGRWFRLVESRRTSEGDILMTGLGDQPLLALERFGDGRVAQLMSDHIWLWARGVEGGGPQAELLRRMAHWLMREPELEEERLSAQVKGRRVTVERRSLEALEDLSPVTLTTPSGIEKVIDLEAVGPGLQQVTITADEIGLYKVEDANRSALAAVGELNPLELSDLRATDEVLSPLAEATGGAVRWVKDGLPSLRRVVAGRDTNGQGWFGFLGHDAYVVTGVKEVALLPGLLLALLILAPLMGAWWREGR